MLTMITNKLALTENVGQPLSNLHSEQLRPQRITQTHAEMDQHVLTSPKHLLFIRHNLFG